MVYKVYVAEAFKAYKLKASLAQGKFNNILHICVGLSFVVLVGFGNMLLEFEILVTRIRLEHYMFF